jgi:DNA-binding cell septation regulator SpoVG
MRITEVQITPIKPNNGLVALANVVADNALYLGSIGIHTRLDGKGYRITYPTKSLGNRSFNIFHPINKDTARAIELAVLAKAEEVLTYPVERSNDNVRHNNTNNPKRSVSFT